LPISKRLVVIIIIFFIAATAAPIKAWGEGFLFEHSAQYHLSGLIDFDREIGDPCNTGVVKRDSIFGYGELFRVEKIKMAPYVLSIEEKNNWSTFSDAIGNLTVATTIRLCARPMSGTLYHDRFSAPGDLVYREGIIHTYADAVIDGSISAYGLTEQIWAVEISTNPGHSGSYHADLFAAYGPGPYDKYGYEQGLTDVVYDPDKSWWFDSSKEDGIEKGRYYVGNYFNIDQYAYTSDGAMKRYIDISSPFSNAYLFEDMEFIGMVEVQESFNMENISYGREGAPFVGWRTIFRPR